MKECYAQPVQKLVAEELDRSMEKFGGFNSFHEGYAVLLEEKQEHRDEEKKVGEHMWQMWQAIKRNDPEDARRCAAAGLTAAGDMVIEAVQVAAMLAKMLEFADGKGGERK